MKISIIVLSIGLTMAGSVHAECSKSDRAALEALDRAWGEAARKGDAKALEAIYSKDFASVTPGETTDRQAAIADAIAGASQASDSVVKPDFYQIHCSGDAAVITHRNVITLGNGDNAETRYARSVHHMVKEGGNWRALANTGHPLGDAGVVTYLDLEWNLADIAADKTWFERNLADDYVGVSSRTGKITSKAEAIAEVGTYKITQADSTEVATTVDGGHARVTGIYHTHGTDKDGKPFTRKTRYIDSFIKRDGRWQIWSSQGTEIK